MDIANTNIVVWCHPRSGSHNLIARLRTTMRNLDLHTGNLYEMFPDHSALVGKECHSEFSIMEVSRREDEFSNGLHWQLDDHGLVQSTHSPNWCYLSELEHRLSMLESKQIHGPSIGKHITWWNRFTESIKGSHDSYADRVHGAVAGAADRNIILYRQELVDFAASMSVLDLSYIESGRRRGRIKTHGQILVTSDDPAVAVNTDRLNRYIDRLVLGFKYLDPARTVMISTEELDQMKTITWPDGATLAVDDQHNREFRSEYMRRDAAGNVAHVPGALGVIGDAAAIHEWASIATARHDWMHLREKHGFVRGF